MIVDAWFTCIYYVWAIWKVLKWSLFWQNIIKHPYEIITKIYSLACFDKRLSNTPMRLLQKFVLWQILLRGTLKFHGISCFAPLLLIWVPLWFWGSLLLDTASNKIRIYVVWGDKPLWLSFMLLTQSISARWLGQTR